MDKVQVNWADFWAACRISPKSPKIPAQLLVRILQVKYSFDDKGIRGDAELKSFLAAKQGEIAPKAQLGRLQLRRSFTPTLLP